MFDELLFENVDHFFSTPAKTEETGSVNADKPDKCVYWRRFKQQPLSSGLLSLLRAASAASSELLCAWAGIGFTWTYHHCAAKHTWVCLQMGPHYPVPRQKNLPFEGYRIPRIPRIPLKCGQTYPTFHFRWNQRGIQVLGSGMPISNHSSQLLVRKVFGNSRNPDSDPEDLAKIMLKCQNPRVQEKWSVLPRVQLKLVTFQSASKDIQSHVQPSKSLWTSKWLTDKYYPLQPPSPLCTFKSMVDPKKGC